MKKCKKPSAIAAGIPGMANGGPATPELLGWGMARGAGRILAGRGPQLARAEAEAMGDAPAAPAAPAAIAGPGGGLSKIRDGAVPPAHMLAAQRRGLADGGMPPGYAPMTPERQAEIAATVTRMNSPPHKTRFATGTPYGERAYREIIRERGPSDLRNVAQGVADQRAASGLPSVAQIRKNLGMADGGRGNAGKLGDGDGGAVRGPGGPTADKVGPVMLSDSEYVLPSDTVEAMGGAQALDKIRAATHKFVDPANKPAIASGIKGLKNGGLPGYSVGEAPVEEINIGRSRADRAAIDEAVKRGQRPPGMAKNPANTPALDRISNRMQSNNMTKAPSSRTAGIAKGLGATGLMMGAYDSLKDLDTGYRDKFQQDMGVETTAGSVVADTVRTLGNVGDAVTFGLAGRTGRGIASAIGGGSFMDGFASPSDRDRFLAQKEGAQSVAPPGAGQQPPVAAQETAPAAAQVGGAETAPATPLIGKINVTRQPNGVMSFSGKDRVDGYSGPAAGQLKGGGSSGAVTPADYQAAVQRANNDKAGVVSMAASYAANGDREGAYRMAAGDPAATAAVEQAFQQRELRQAALNGNSSAASILNNQGNNETSRRQIAAGMPYEQERTRGTKLANDQSALLSQMVNTYLNAPDEATRTDALTKLNALNGKNGWADKYITVDMESGVDALGNPIIRKVPFNTRTGQIVDVSGQGGGGGAAKGGYPDGTRLNWPDGRAYIVKNGEPVPVQ